MKSFKDLKQQLNENGVSTSFVSHGANQHDGAGKYNMLAIENPRVIDRLNAAISHITRNPRMDPDTVICDIRDTVLPHAALSMEGYASSGEGTHRYALKQYGGRKGVTPEEGFIDDDGITNKLGHGMDLQVTVTKDANNLYNVEAFIVPAEELEEEEEEELEEAVVVPLVRKGQGTSRVDIHPKRKDGKIERMYQANNKNEYTSLIIAADTSRKGNQAHSVQGSEKRKTVTVVFDNDKQRRSYEKRLKIKESVEHLDEALTLASDNLNLVKKTAQKLAKQSPDLTYYVVKHKTRFLKGMEYAYYEVYQSVDMHLVRGKAKKIAGYGAKVDMRESVELDEATATRTAVDREFAKVTRSGKMDTMAAIKYLEKKFKITGVQIEKDKNGKAHVISFQESVNELDEAKSPVKSLGKEAKAVLAMALNMSMDGGVVAQDTNLEYFTPEAIDAAIKFLDKNSKKLTPAGRHAAREVVKKLGESVELDEVSEAKKYRPSKITKPGRKGGMPTGSDRGDDSKPLMMWLDKLEKELKKKSKSYDDVDPDDALIVYYRGDDPKKAARELLSGKKIKESATKVE